MLTNPIPLNKNEKEQKGLDADGDQIPVFMTLTSVCSEHFSRTVLCHSQNSKE